MKKISSRMTTMHKRVLPLLWFGIIGVVTALIIFVSVKKEHPVPVVALIMPIFMSIVFVVVWKLLIADLVDEVYDCGDHLVVRNKGREECVDLHDIINIGYSNLTNPKRVTLDVRFQGRPGKKITYEPKFRFGLRLTNPDVEDLIVRVDRARRDGGRT